MRKYFFVSYARRDKVYTDVTLQRKTNQTTKQSKKHKQKTKTNDKKNMALMQQTGLRRKISIRVLRVQNNIYARELRTKCQPWFGISAPNFLRISNVFAKFIVNFSPRQLVGSWVYYKRLVTYYSYGHKSYMTQCVIPGVGIRSTRMFLWAIVIPPHNLNSCLICTLYMCPCTQGYRGGVINVNVCFDGLLPLMLLSAWIIVL